MDQMSFDRLARLLAAAGSRRQALRALLAAAVGAGAAETLAAADAKGGKGKKGKGKGRGKGKGKSKSKKSSSSSATGGAGGASDGGDTDHCNDDPLLPGQDYIGCDFSGDDLQGIDLFSSSFQKGVDFSDANLCGADLHGSSFSESSLVDATLAGANLRTTSHSKSDYSGANFFEADFEVATFSKVNLTGANLSGANLRGATFDDETLATLGSAILCNTTLPDGTVVGDDCDQCDNTCGCHGCHGDACNPPDCCVDPETGDGYCTDTQNGDPLNCGSCNTACLSSQADNCIEGECACGEGPACTGGSTCIEGQCTGECGSDSVYCVDEQGVGDCYPGVCCQPPLEGAGCAGELVCVAGACIGEGQYRIVLRWNQDPRDLDSHLWLPEATPYHIYYADPGSLTEFPFAELDIDDTTSFGPETITIAEVETGVYTYAVFHFAGSGSIGTSGAIVDLYQGANLLKTYTVPQSDLWNDPAYRWWNVFTLNSDGTITDVDEPATNVNPYAGLLRSAGVHADAMPPKSPARGKSKRRQNSKKRKARGRGRR